MNNASPNHPGSLRTGRTWATVPRGMTLIEIMVVLFIVTGLVGGGIYMMSLLTHGKLKDEAMRFSSTAQYTYDQAALNNRQYRLVIDLDSGEYFTEVTESDVIMDTGSEEAQAAYEEGLLPDEAREMEAKREADRSQMFNEDGDDPFGISRRTGYQRPEDGLVEPRQLEEGIRFEQVLTESRERPVRDGRAAVHFFPNGMQQQAHIVLVDDASGAKFTLITEPLTGRIRTFSGDEEVPEDFGEVESDDRF